MLGFLKVPWKVIKSGDGRCNESELLIFLNCIIYNELQLAYLNALLQLGWKVLSVY